MTNDQIIERLTGAFTIAKGWHNYPDCGGSDEVIHNMLQVIQSVINDLTVAAPADTSVSALDMLERAEVAVRAKRGGIPARLEWAVKALMEEVRAQAFKDVGDKA